MEANQGKPRSLKISECAEILKLSDPEKYTAALLAPKCRREKLFALYYCSNQIANAAWASQEPLICQIRLEWWREQLTSNDRLKALEDTFYYSLYYFCENDSTSLTLLNQMVDRRAWDISCEPFPSQQTQDTYIDETEGNLMWLACSVLGAPSDLEKDVRDFAYGVGIAKFLKASSRLKELNRQPLIDPSPLGLTRLATNAKIRYIRAKKSLKPYKELYPVLLAGCQTSSILNEVIKWPNRVLLGGLAKSDFKARLNFLFHYSFRIL